MEKIKGVYRTSIETWPLNIFFSKKDIDLGLFFPKCF